MSKTILLKPRMSEKTYAQSNDRVYVFVVPTDVNKFEISKTVQDTYDVTVTNVRTSITKGKPVRSYKNKRFINGKRSDFKKAYVTVKEGDAIPIFAAVEEAEEKADKNAKIAEKVAKKQAKKDKKEK